MTLEINQNTSNNNCEKYKYFNDKKGVKDLTNRYKRIYSFWNHVQFKFYEKVHFNRHKIFSKQTLYIFKAEHHVMILSSLPNVMVDDSLAMEEGRLLDPDDNVDFGRNVAIFS